MAVATEQLETPAPATKREERRALGVASSAHVLHDGFTDLVYVALPIWQAEFGLSYAAVGLLRTVFSGTMASLQIPSSFLAERAGAAVVLAVGTALAGLCFCLTGLATDYPWLIAALLLGGLGASTQHPIGSALVTRVFAGPRALTAFGTYNFAGDIGKILLPGLATLILLVLPWRAALSLIGALGIVGAFAIFLLMPKAVEQAVPSIAPNPQSATPRGGLHDGFLLLLAIAAIDGITRAGFTVFLPFVMIAKGASVAVAGLALTLTFVGGATGKLVCAWLGARLGVVLTIALTEILTAAGMIAVLVLSLEASLALLPIVGAVLNGTSSVTYGSVPQFAAPAARARAFSLFYTGALFSAAVTPTIAGFIGDAFGVSETVTLVAALALLTLPLAWLLRPAFAAAQTG